MNAETALVPFGYCLSALLAAQC